MNASAAVARSILSCPTALELSVDGRPHSLDDDTWLGLEDWAGTPTLMCVHGGALSEAGQRGGLAELAVESKIREGEAIILSGQLRLASTETCECCGGLRDYIALDLSAVMLVRGSERVPVDPDDFADPALGLNDGFLRRMASHINERHGEHLRQTIAALVNLPVRGILGAQLANLTPGSVEVQWVSPAGAHRTVLHFPSDALGPDELDYHLRRSLRLEQC